MLNIILEDDDAPGEWFIGGVQDDGEIAVLVYNRDFATYALLADEDEGLYVFDLSSPTTVSGCFYERFGPESFSDCYPMTGVKTSSRYPYPEFTETGSTQHYSRPSQN